MAWRLTSAPPLARPNFKRVGKYDQWLDGALWSLRCDVDANWFDKASWWDKAGKLGRLQKAIRARAALRGRKVAMTVAESDGRILLLQAFRPSAGSTKSETEPRLQFGELECHSGS